MGRLQISIIIGVAALGLAGAASPIAKPAPAAAVAPADPTYAPYADRTSDDCYRAADHDAADLCAQWRASVAAEAAVKEARYATWAGIGATLVSALGLIGLLYSLWQTRGALAEAQRANEITLRNELRAEEQAKEEKLNIARQLRAYMGAFESRILFDGFPRLSLKFKNYGATPATIVSTRICVMVDEVRPVTVKFDPDWEIDIHRTHKDVPPTSYIERIIPLDAIVAQFGDEIAEGALCLYVRVDLETVDIYGGIHWSRTMLGSYDHQYRNGGIGTIDQHVGHEDPKA